jgi:hypothetical protein
MADVEKLLAEFAEELRTAGEADPRPYLRQVEGAERRELAALIDACIENAPRRAWDPEAFKGSAAESWVSRHEDVVAADVEPLEKLLPRLRRARKLKRAMLTQRLADALGFPDREEKVGLYYHRLEQGMIPADGVSSRVFDALGSVLGESADRLRASARRMTEGAGGPSGGAVFARVASPAPDLAADAGLGSPARQEEDGEWDEIDELFRSGD